MTKLAQFKEFRNKELSKLLNNQKGGYILSDTICEAIVNANPLTISDLYGIKGFPRGGTKFEKLAQPIVDWFINSKNF